jgi:hypothetical protein
LEERLFKASFLPSPEGKKPLPCPPLKGRELDSEFLDWNKKPLPNPPLKGRE